MGPAFMSQPGSDVNVFKDDLKKVISGSMCENHQALTGGFVFEFQTSYWKGPGDQLVFGLYELGSIPLGKTIPAEQTQWNAYDVWCVRKKRNNKDESWVDAVAEVFAGEVAGDADCPCPCPAWHSLSLMTAVNTTAILA